MAQPAIYSDEHELAVLGGCMFRPTYIDEVAGILTAEDFYRDRHARIWRAMVELSRRGVEIDASNVYTEVTHVQMLDGLTSAQTLYEMLEPSFWTAEAAKYHAGLVRNLAVLRAADRAMADSRVEIAKANPALASEVLDRIDGRIYGLRSRQMTDDGPITARNAVKTAIDAISERMAGGGAGSIGTGLADLDGILGGMKLRKMSIWAGRPSMGKSALALNIAINAARQGCGVAYMSIEDDEVQWSVRALASISGVPMPTVQISKRRHHPDEQDMDKRYHMPSEQDFSEIYRAADELAGLPIYIDTTSAPTPEFIRARIRVLKRRADIKLVVVDYLQLMRPPQGKRYGSREQEVASMSSALVAIAKDTDTHVMLVSQLNRKSVERADKRPTMQDLRECIAGDELVYDAATGRNVPAREIAGGLTVASLTPALLVGYSPDAVAWSTGVKPVFRMRTKTGRTIRCTAGHRFLVFGGWRELGDLVVGQRIAVPRVLPPPLNVANEVSADEARLLGYLISDGTYIKHRSVGYVKADPVCVADVRRIALERFGIVAKSHRCQPPAEQIELTGAGGPGSNPIIVWLTSLGIYDQRGHQKRAPAALFRCGNETIATFVGALWAGDGAVVKRRSGWVLKFTSTSMGLLRDLQHLLTRLGVISAISKPGRNTKSTMDIATLMIGEAEAILMFASAVAIPGIKGKRLDACVAECRTSGRNARIDRLPLEATEAVRLAKETAGVSWSELGYRCQGKEIGRYDMARVAETLDNDWFRHLGRSDVLWDEIDSIEPDGEEETFDLSVPDRHNFVVSGFLTHNSGSLEQDAYSVTLVHRPGFYDEKGDQTAAELIVDKNKDGTRGVANVLFHGEIMRFRDREWKNV